MTKQIFLSHATADKEQYVIPFARKLDELGVSYWLDEAEIKWGDKIGQKINDGLNKSSFVVVFLTTSFVGRNWTETELSAALSRENDEGRVVVLPIVVGDPKEILANYPLLRDKSYQLWDRGLDALVSELKRCLGLLLRDEEPIFEKTYEGHSDAVNCIAVLDYRHFLSGSSDNTIRLWDIDSKECIRIFAEHKRTVIDIVVIPNSNRFISSSWDNKLLVWEVSSEHCFRKLEGHTRGVLAIAITQDGKYVISGSADFTMRVWDWDKEICISEFKNFDHAVCGVAVSPDNKYIYSSSDNKVQQWDIHNSEEALKTFKCTCNVYGIEITSDGRHIIACLKDGSLQIFDIASERCLGTILGHTYQTWKTLVTPDNCYILSCSADTTVRMWSLSYKTAVAIFKGHTESVNAISLTYDSNHILTASSDKTLRMWPLPPLPYLLFSLDFCETNLCNTSTKIIRLMSYGNVKLYPDEGFLWLDGGYIDLDRHPDLDRLSSFLIETVITPNHVGGVRQNILEAQNPAIAFAIDHNSRLAGSINTATGWIGLDSGRERIQAGVTTQVSFLRDKTGKMELKIDGKIVAEKRVAGPIENVGENGFRIGAWTDGREYLFKGRIAGVKIYKLPY